MRRVIYKFPLKPQGEFTIAVPCEWWFRSVGVQRLSADPMMWAEVNPHSAQIDLRFRMILTGETFEHDKWIFLGTVLLYGGDFVAHLHVERHEP